MTPMQAHVVAIAVEERYRELRKLRLWYRLWAPRLGRPEWVSESIANRAALRELVRIRWTARRASRGAHRQLVEVV